MIDCYFYGNSANASGGALTSSNNIYAVVNNAQFYRNKANLGAAFYVASTSTLYMSNSKIALNKVTIVTMYLTIYREILRFILIVRQLF